MVKPIPKRLLIHTATLSDVTVTAFQSEALQTAAVLQHVRIEPSTRLVTTKDNRQINLAAALFLTAAIAVLHPCSLLWDSGSPLPALCTVLRR